MHLLQVVPYDSYPPRMGGDHRSHGLVKELPTAGDDVFRYCQGGSPKLYKSLDFTRKVTIQDGYTEYRHLHPLHEIVKAPMLRGYPNLFAGWTLRVASDGLKSKIRRSDVIMVREPWQFETINQMVPESTPIVYSSHNVETERFSEITQPIFEQRTVERVRELEQYAVNHADLIVTTSERDSAVYRNEFGSTTSHIVAPNGTYEDAIRSHRPDSAEAGSLRSQYGLSSDATVCLFIGSNYQPNVLASEHIIKFARELPSTEFVIMGSVGNDFDPQNIPSNVTITGYIEEKFESHFDMVDIALNPMTTGGGTNIKLLDYFARSLPVISTPFGVRGIQVETDNAVVIADIEDFSNAISTLTSNTEQQKEIGNSARQLAANRYTWEGASIRLRDRLLELIRTTTD